MNLYNYRITELIESINIREKKFIDLTIELMELNYVKHQNDRNFWNMKYMLKCI